GSLERFGQLGADERLGVLLEQARAANLLPPDIGLDQIRRLLDVFKANLRAMRAAVARPYAGRIALFRAADRLAADEPDPTLGWGALAAGGVEVQVVAGDHYTIVREPHVRALAERLGACLDAVREG